MHIMNRRQMSQEINLDNEFDKQVLDYAIKVGKAFLKYNTDIKPSVSFYMDRSKVRLVMMIRDEATSAFIANLDRQLHEKFIIDGAFDTRIYYLLLKHLGLLQQ